jgi:hypothetical protein
MSIHSLCVALRVPGAWTSPDELIKRLPKGVRIETDELVLPDGEKFEIMPMPADEQFQQVFLTACRGRPTQAELGIMTRYTVQVGLRGFGGSMDAARAMMRAGAALVRAGGAGVFIDNSALAHGGTNWLSMTDDGGIDAVSFAFTSIIRGQAGAHTMGMNVMGLPDIQLRAEDLDDDGDTIVEIIRYMCGGEKTIDVGHVLADDQLRPRFQAVARVDDEFPAESVMHNPSGRLKFTSIGGIAEGN